MCWGRRPGHPVCFPEGHSPGTGVTGKASRHSDPCCPPTSKEHVPTNVSVEEATSLAALLSPPHIPVTKLTLSVQHTLIFQRNGKSNHVSVTFHTFRYTVFMRLRPVLFSSCEFRGSRHFVTEDTDSPASALPGPVVTAKMSFTLDALRASHWVKVKSPSCISLTTLITKRDSASLFPSTVGHTGCHGWSNPGVSKYTAMCTCGFKASAESRPPVFSEVTGVAGLNPSGEPDGSPPTYFKQKAHVIKTVIYRDHFESRPEGNL